MAPRSSRKAGLDLEDFRRLGVRPHEYRLTVIRRAAIRSARALAEQQLSAPTTQTAAQLSRVATSAYRLLDPRQRQETSHRAYVGRILPQALSWAGHTNFHNELSDFGSTAGEIGKLPFERSSLSDAELIELLDLDSSPRPKHVSKPTWANHLSDADLLQTTPLSRRVNRWNARARFPWLTLAAAGLLFGASLSFATHRWLAAEPAYVLHPEGATTPDSQIGSPRPDQHTERPPTANADQYAASPKSTPRVGRRLVPDEMRELFSNEEVGKAASNIDQTVSDADHDHGSIGELAQSSDRANSLSSEAADVALSNHDVLNPKSPSLAEADDASSQAALPVSSDAENSTETLALDSRSTLPDPFGPDVEIDLALKPDDQALSGPGPVADETFADDKLANDEFANDEFANDTDGQSDVVTPDASMPVVAASETWPGFPQRGLGGSRRAGWLRVSMPSEASRHTALRELTEFMPQLDTTMEAQDARARIEQLESVEQQYKIGSPEQWVIRTLIAEAAWLFESVAQVEERLNSLVAMYDVSSEQLLAETFVGASRHAYLPSTCDHLMGNGFRLSDQFLLASAPAECHQVVEALTPLVLKLPGRDEFLRQCLRDFSDAADLMIRQAVVIERAQGQSDHPTAADSKVLGQHYCLMLRRWDVGLEWLSDSYDRRVARVARQELQLGENPTPDQLKTVGQQWLAAAARSDGRAADSIRLHAIELLRQAQPKADALARLEIDRMMEDAIENLPPHLVPLPGAQLGSTRGSGPISPFPTGGAPLF